MIAKNIIFDPNSRGSVICFCNMVTKSEIRKAANRFGLTHVQEIGLATRAGTSCGKCVAQIQDLLKRLDVKNPQLPIPWDDPIHQNEAPKGKSRQP